MAHCNVDVEGVVSLKLAPPRGTPELQKLKKPLEDQHMVMEGLRKDLADLSAKSQAAAKSKMAVDLRCARRNC